MKKIIITLASVAAICISTMLASCGGNTATNGMSTTGGSSPAVTESTTEAATENKSGNIIDDAESIIEDMSEDATHAIDNGTPGGDSHRNFGRGVRDGK